MRKKEGIDPPSKSKRTEEQEALEKLNNLASEYSKARKEYLGLKHFDEAAKGLAKNSNLTETEIKQTFQSNKGELVSKFRQSNALRSDSNFGLVVTPVVGALTAFSAYAGLTLDKSLFTITAISSLATIFFTKLISDERKKVKRINTEIENKVLEFKNNPRLPVPKS